MRKLFAGLVLFTAPAMAQSQPSDQPITVSGVETVCTGVGSDSREDPRWKAYPLKVEMAAVGGHYLGSETVTVSRGGQPVVKVTCDGPWALFRLPPGRYTVDAVVGSETASSGAVVPASGQGRIVLRFKGE